MRYLLDECLSDLTAKTMAVLGAPDEFVYILDVAAQSLHDLDIPALCQVEHFDTLVTIKREGLWGRGSPSTRL